MSQADEPTRAVPPITDPTQAVPATTVAPPVDQPGPWVVDPGPPGGPPGGDGYGGGGWGGDGYGGEPPTRSRRCGGARSASR